MQQLKNVGTALVLLLALINVQPAAASIATEIVLDQSYKTTTNLSATLAEGFAYTGQSVTAGVSGYLSKAELFYTRRSTLLTPWVITVRPLNAQGHTTATVVALETLAAAEV